MSIERVKPREIDLTRHVRTPAGVAYYHKPIGSPLGGGGSAPRVRASGLNGKDARTMTATEKIGAAEVMHGTGSKQHLVAQKKLGRVTKKEAAKAARSIPAGPKFNEAEHGPRDIAAFRNDPAVVRLGAMAARLTKPGPTSGKGLVSGLTDKDAADARRDLVGGSVTGNLWQLDPKRLEEAINNPNVDPARLRALKIEKAKRLAVAQNILGKKAEVKDAIKKAGDNPGKITKAVHAHAPAPVAHVFDVVTEKGRKIKNADHAQSIVDAVWDWLLRAVLTAGAVVLAAHTGIMLGG